VEIGDIINLQKVEESSSRFRIESWHPSQEVNLKTPILGLFISGLSHAEKFFHFGIFEDRAVSANKFRSEKTVAADAHAAVHVSLH
jgi:hypothetical protein